MDTAAFERAKRLFLDGVAQLEAKQFEQAEASFEASLGVLPDRASTLTNLGTARIALDKFDAALAALDRSLTVDDSQADAWCQRGIALEQLQRPADARPCFERAAALQPRLLDAWYGLGCICNVLHQHADALTAFERLLALDAGHGEGFFRHGQTLQALERHDEAFHSYERALALDPTHVQAWINRAGILRDRGHKAEAIGAYRQALHHGGDAATIDYLLAALEGRAPPAAPPAYVQGLFDDYAERFDHHLVDVLHYRGHQVLAEMLRDAAAGRRFARALDLGCGTGLCGVHLKDLAQRLDGVDLSPQMLTRAQRLQVYDQLIAADVVQHVAATPLHYGLVAAADVFTYLGDLDPLFAGVARVLEPAGLFGFSIELTHDDQVDYALRGSLRYAHSRRYIADLAARHGLRTVRQRDQTMREDQRQPIPALFVVLAR